MTLLFPALPVMNNGSDIYLRLYVSHQNTFHFVMGLFIFTKPVHQIKHCLPSTRNDVLVPADVVSGDVIFADLHIVFPFSNLILIHRAEIIISAPVTSFHHLKLHIIDLSSTRLDKATSLIMVVFNNLKKCGRQSA